MSDGKISFGVNPWKSFPLAQWTSCFRGNSAVPFANPILSDGFVFTSAGKHTYYFLAISEQLKEMFPALYENIMGFRMEWVIAESRFPAIKANRWGFEGSQLGWQINENGCEVQVCVSPPSIPPDPVEECDHRPVCSSFEELRWAYRRTN